VHINGECWLIQAKRYSRAIAPAHVRDFDALLTRMGSVACLFIPDAPAKKAEKSVRYRLS